MSEWCGVVKIGPGAKPGDGVVNKNVGGVRGDQFLMSLLNFFNVTTK